MKSLGRTSLIPALIPALILCVGSAPAAAQVVNVETVARPTGRVVKISTAPAVDGILDEDLWRSVPVMTDFVQSQPDAGAPATESTEVRIAYDDQALYVGIRSWDSEAGAWVVPSLEHDFPGLNTRDGDILGISFDTFLDRRNSFIFLINPFGAYRDGQTFNDSRVTDFGWDGVFDLATTQDQEGWTIEMAIPWSTLRFSGAPGPQEWGFNVLRRIRRKSEDSYWAPLERRDPLHRMSRAGTLEGFEDLKPGSGLRIKPYLLTDNRRGPATAPEDRGSSFELGGDLKYGLTSTLTLDLTVNTDFSQVEVDEAQVNLTRFPLFLAEQREFFLENSGSFTFGDVVERGVRMGTRLSDFTLFHSRRIGLENGSPIPIVGGGRVSGGVGSFEVGLLNMQTGAADGLPSENFTVARLRRDVGARADMGVLFTQRMSTGDGPSVWNRAVGFDANARPFGGMILNAYLATTSESESGTATVSEGSPWAGRMSVAWRDQLWDASAQVRRIGDDFDPGVGFVRRRDITQYYATVGTHHSSGLPLTQEINPWVDVSHIADLEGRLLTRSQAGGLNWDFSDGSQFQASAKHRMEQLDSPFLVQGEGLIQAGAYDFDEWTVGYTSSTGRPLSLGMTLTGGGYFAGDRRSTTLTARWLPSPHITLNANAGFNRIELPGTAPFDSNVFGGRLKAALNTTMFASAYLQYIELTDELVSNVRLNWIHAPLSDVFLVLTERRHLGDNGLEADRLVTLKMTRLLSF